MSIIDYDKIQHEYDMRRVRNISTAQQRRDEVFSKIPELKTITEELPQVNLQATRNRILKIATNKNDIKDKTTSLSARKKELLLAHGYSQDYLDPIYVCPLCQDTGSLKNGENCDCFKKLFTEQLYQQSNIKARLENASFETFSLEYYSKEPDDRFKNRPTAYKNSLNVLNSCKSFVANFEKDFQNLFIYGETGLGKTLLTLCIAKELIDKGHHVLYMSSSILFNKVLGDVEMNRCTDPGTLAMYRYVSTCQLLIIDDLGTEFTNSYVTSKLFELINERSTKQLSTIISSNLNPKEMSERYSERINSRIIEGYTVLPMYGNNIRYINAKKKLTQKAND